MNSQPLAGAARPGLLRDTLITALVPIMWGSTFIVTSELLPPGRPLWAALLRTLPAGVLLLALYREWPRRADWGRLLLLSLLNIGLFQALLFTAAYRLPGGIAAVAGSAQTLVVLGLMWAVLGQAPRPAAALACCMGVLGMGVMLISPESHFDAIGVAAALGGALCFGTAVFLGKHWSLRLSLPALAGWQLLLGGLMLLPAALLFDTPLPKLTPTHMLAYGYLGLFGALLAYLLWFRGLQRLPAVAVASLGLLSPVTAVMLGWLLLGQSLGLQAQLGMVMVLGSVLAVQLMGSAPGGHSRR
ncbi:EamA family transporter [Roseateles sp. BYS180W]|uniref:EamA family transporter n=1 Tax=Roseateles rivi TaxID=3299028 RepID=A0ABW7FVB0_9BURK